MLESLSEASSFMNTIPKELRDRENYLNLNKDYRLEYDRLKAKFASWMKEAKHNLESAEEDKNDDKNIVSNLEKFKVHNKIFISPCNNTYCVILLSYFSEIKLFTIW